MSEFCKGLDWSEKLLFPNAPDRNDAACLLGMIDRVNQSPSGVVSEPELNNALASSSFTSDEKGPLARFAGALKHHRVGHKIGSHEQSGIIIIGEVSLPTTDIIEDFGIGREELEKLK